MVEASAQLDVSSEACYAHWPHSRVLRSVCPTLMCSLTHPRLSLQTKPVDPTVDGGAQVQQVVNIECVSDFMEAPVLNIQFR